jgi:hypothetical protein
MYEQNRIPKRVWQDLPFFFQHTYERYGPPSWFLPLESDAVSKFKSHTAFLARACETPELWGAMTFLGMVMQRKALEEELPSPKGAAAGNAAAEVDCML